MVDGDYFIPLFYQTSVHSTLKHQQINKYMQFSKMERGTWMTSSTIVSWSTGLSSLSDTSHIKDHPFISFSLLSSSSCSKK